MQKKISTLTGTIIIVAVAVVLFAGVFVYQYFTKTQTPITNVQSNLKLQNQNTQTENVITQTPVDETAKWKTYTNTQYGFEMKYPANFKATDDSLTPNNLSLHFGYNNTPYIGDISMQVFKNTRNETALQYFEREKNSAIQGFASKCQTCANLDIDAELYDCLASDAGVIKVADKDGFFCENMPQKATYSTPVYVFSGDYIYRFFNYDETNPSYKIYKNMLSTFKFTK